MFYVTLVYEMPKKKPHASINLIIYIKKEYIFICIYIYINIYIR